MEKFENKCYNKFGNGSCQIYSAIHRRSCMVVSQENSILTLEYMTKEKENQFFDRKSAKNQLEN